MFEVTSREKPSFSDARRGSSRLAACRSTSTSRARKGQGLPNDLAACSDWLRDSMAMLDAPEKDAIRVHTVNNDLPEPCAALRAQAEAAGPRLLDVAAPQKWRRLMLFLKA
jgi:hypothetical protein